MAKLHFKPTRRLLTGRGMHVLIALHECASRSQTMLIPGMCWCTPSWDHWHPKAGAPSPREMLLPCQLGALLDKTVSPHFLHSFACQEQRLILTLWILNFLWCNYCLTLQPFQAPYIRKKRELNMRSLKIKLLKGDRSCFVSSRNDVVPLGEDMLSQRRCSALRQCLLLYFSEVLCFSEVLRCSAFRNEPVLSLHSCKTRDFHMISQANLLLQTTAKISLP